MGGDYSGWHGNHSGGTTVTFSNTLSKMLVEQTEGAGVQLRYAVFALVAFGLALSGCGAPKAADVPNESKRKLENERVTQEESTPLGRASTLVGFGEGSLWIADHGDYACDDTPGVASGEDEVRVMAGCVGPEETFLRRIDPGNRETGATVRFEGPNVMGISFGAGSVWLSLDSYRPAGGSVAKLNPTTNEIVAEVRVESPSGMDFGHGSLWVASRTGTISRINPQSDEVEAEIPVSAGGANDVAVDERSGAVWVAVQGAPEEGGALSPEDYERGTRPEPGEDSKLVRIDPGTNQAVAEIPIEENAIEGGTSSVAVGRGAVWVTSVNGKLLRVDPETNRVVARLSIGDYSFDVEASEEAVWTTSEANVNDYAAYTHRLTRVDPGNNRIAGSIDVQNVSGLALDGRSAWATTGNIETGEGSLFTLAP